LEWFVFVAGLVLLGFMNPENTGHTFCLFEWAGISFCPGEGLGHSIAYTFRGEFTHAINAHFVGPVAVIILASRIVHIWYRNYQQYKIEKKELYG
jgi:hypothetical protein